MIADFGLSKISIHTQTSTKSQVGTALWMAPEMTEPGAKYSVKVDVFAFGIIVWELLSCCHPYSTISGIENPIQLMMFVKSGQRMPIDPEWNRKLSNLVEQAWHQDPTQRPTMNIIVSLLTNL